MILQKQYLKEALISINSMEMNAVPKASNWVVDISRGAN